MKHTISAILLVTGTALINNADAAFTFTLTGGSITSINDDLGSPLSTGSIFQVGYFDGVDTAKDPATYTPADWSSFTAISGIDSLNPSKLTSINDAGGVGTGTHDLSLNYDTAVDQTPAAYPVRLGFRYFDSTTTTLLVNFNTVASSENTWKLLDRSGDPKPPSPTPTIFGSGDAGLTWQDNTNPFKTTITAVPEPSSFALLGLGGMALLFRRRK